VVILLLVILWLEILWLEILWLVILLVIFWLVILLLVTLTVGLGNEEKKVLVIVVVNFLVNRLGVETI